jgi:EpsI family protein
MSKIAAAVLFLVLNAYVYWQLGSVEVIPPRETFDVFPDQIANWQCSQRESIDDKTYQALLVTDYLACNFVRDDKNAATHLYIGYHERQTRDRQSGRTSAIHPPEHCLPGSGWDVIDAQIVPIDFLAEAGVGPVGEAKRFIIAKGNQRALVYFWYQSRGRVIARSHEKIFYMFLDRARKGRTDGSLVRFTTPILFGDEDRAEQTFRELARATAPVISDFVPN